MKQKTETIRYRIGVQLCADCEQHPVANWRNGVVYPIRGTFIFRMGENPRRLCGACFFRAMRK